MQRLIALFLLTLLLPLFIILYFIVKLTSKGPFIFKQRRAGKNKKPFYIYKIRTMVENAEELKNNYRNLNEAEGPVFKIRNDPRYTKFGYYLAHSGLDELPQLWNIVKGDMVFIGPRPLPINEANMISKSYKRRFSVLPGISSLWVVRGTDHTNFNNWMKLDLEYVNNNGVLQDVLIALKTIIFLFKTILKL